MRTKIWLCVWMVVAVGVQSAHGLEITGQVVDSKARPVEGAEVAVYEEYAVGRFEDHGKLTAPIVKTDSQGRFQLQANVSSQYDTFIVARKSGLALAWDGLNYSRNVKGKGYFLLVLEPPCAMAGQLVDSSGKPIAKAQVQALPVTSYLDRLRQRPIRAPKEWFTATTDLQGKFRFEQFAADVSATFRVNAPGFISTHVFRPQQQDSCGFEVWRSDLRLVLPGEGTIKGRVVDDRGQPVGGVDLLISPEQLPESPTCLYLARKTQSQPDGTFVIDGTPEGFHRIDVVAPEHGADQWVGKSVRVSLKPGTTVAEAAIQVTRGGIVEVTVLNAQTRRPLVGMKVGVYGQEWRRSEPAIVDAKGVARFRAPAGGYMIEAWSDDFLPGQSNEQVKIGQTVRCQIFPNPRSKFSGRVLDSAGRPVVDAVVTIHPTGDHVYSDDKGRFAGHWDERYGAQGGVAVARDTKNGLASAVRVTNWSRPADLRLGPAWTLIGKIVDPNGVGIPAARVALTIIVQKCLGNSGVELLTDSQGRFEMKAVPPIQDSFDYRLSVNASGYGPRHYLRISASGSPGTAVDLGAISMQSADVFVSGVVMDANGALAARVPVMVNGMPRVDQPMKSTTTNEKGEFSIRRLCKGPIRLQASVPSSPGGAGFIQAELPIQDVKIILGQDIKTTGETPILGKPLPSLGGLSPTLSQARIDGKPVLMCFMDIEQRPSRQCLSELAKKAGALAAQGVSLLVVQTSKVDMKQHETWLKQNGVTIPLHVASADFETKRRAWGVKSLPWLILTDKSHVVRAEGFAVSELDRKIKELENAKP